MEINLPYPLDIKWAYKTDGDIVSSPVHDGETVYVGSHDKKLHAVTLANGEHQWDYQAASYFEAPPLLMGPWVLAPSSDGTLYCLDKKNGKLKWAFKAGAKITGSCNVYLTPSGDTRIVFGSHDHFLYCLNSQGQLLWQYETGSYINSVPCVLSNLVIVGGCDNKVHIVNADTGVAQEPIEVDSYIAGSPVAEDSSIYLGHYGNRALKIDLALRSIQWDFRPHTRSSPFHASPSLLGKHVLFAAKDHYLYLLDKVAGTLVWKFQTLGEVDASPLLLSGQVLGASADGSIYLLHRESGELLWSTDLGDGITSSPAPTPDGFLIGCDDGYLYCFYKKS